MFEIGFFWDLSKIRSVRLFSLLCLGTFNNAHTIKILNYSFVDSNDDQLKKETFQATEVFMMEAKPLNSTNKDYPSFVYLFFTPITSSLFLQKLKIEQLLLLRMIQYCVLQSLCFFILENCIQTVWTKYSRRTLFFLQNSALQEKFNFFFSWVFC